MGSPRSARACTSDVPPTAVVPTVLRDAAVAVADSAGVSAAVEALYGFELALLSRLYLCLLARFPAADLVERLTSPDVFAEADLLSECLSELPAMRLRR
jgi:hypothetical protein